MEHQLLRICKSIELTEFVAGFGACGSVMIRCIAEEAEVGQCCSGGLGLQTVPTNLERDDCAKRARVFMLNVSREAFRPRCFAKVSLSITLCTWQPVELAGAIQIMRKISRHLDTACANLCF